METQPQTPSTSTSEPSTADSDRHAAAADARDESESPTRTFAELGLCRSLCDVLTDYGWETPTPIQDKAIPIVLAGRDFIGCAQTGTGKTGAFGLPLIQRFLDATDQLDEPDPDRGAALHAKGPWDGPLALVLSPTRELADQIEVMLTDLGGPFGLHTALIMGGVRFHGQLAALRKRPTVVIATPGRLIDHYDRRNIELAGVEYLVLDESDRMFDMGFAPQIRRILAMLPKKQRQTVMFSATMPEQLTRLARSQLNDPVREDVGDAGTPPDQINQDVYIVLGVDKADVIVRLLELEQGRVLVFTRTKRRADLVAHFLTKAHVSVERMHADCTQAQRQSALAGFKDGTYRVLVATDIVSRGIDVDDIARVINYDVPNSPEDYVHRIGRTARAGVDGHASTLVDAEDLGHLKDIERKLGRRLPRADLETGAIIEEAQVTRPTSKAARRLTRGRRPGRRR